MYDYQINNDYPNLNIKIGDPDVYLSGKHWYHISYKAYNLINPLIYHDEFYWNVTGNGWDFPIETADVNIELLRCSS